VLIQADRWRTVPLGLLHFQGEFGARYPEPVVDTARKVWG
jgi:hypothetical protein